MSNTRSGRGLRCDEAPTSINNLYIKFVYLGLRACQHLRSLAPVMNDDNDGQIIFGDFVDLKLSDICLTGDEKPRKKRHPGNLSRPGIEPGPVAWQARMLPPAPQWWTPDLILPEKFIGYRSRVRKSRYWRETLQFPHPLLWRNEASLLVHWRTMYFPLALWTLVCVHCVLSAQRPVLLCAQNTSLRRHTDVVGDSSGRSYVSERWHNVPLLRTRGIDCEQHWSLYWFLWHSWYNAMRKICSQIWHIVVYHACMCQTRSLIICEL